MPYDIRGLVNDPQFQGMNPEDQSALLKQAGAPDGFINEYIESGVDKGPAPAADFTKADGMDIWPMRGEDGEQITPELASTRAKIGVGLAAAAPLAMSWPTTAAGYGKLALGTLGSMGGAKMGEMGAKAFHLPPIVGAIPGAVAGAVVPGMATHGGIGLLARLLSGQAAKAVAPTAGEAALGMSRGEMMAILRGANAPAEGFVADPAVAEVAANMIPKGGMAPLGRAEMAAAVRGATGGAETSVASVGREMAPAGAVRPFTQGEATSVVRGISKAPEGFVENPSPTLVDKFMEPATAEGKLISDLMKAGFTPDKAREVAANVTRQAAGAAESATPAAASTAASTTASSTEGVLLPAELTQGQLQLVGQLKTIMQQGGASKAEVMKVAQETFPGQWQEVVKMILAPRTRMPSIITPDAAPKAFSLLSLGEIIRRAQENVTKKDKTQREQALGPMAP
jgi:hypothetical protein